MFKSQGIFKGNQQDNTNIFPLDIIVDKQLSNDEIITTCIQIFSLPPDTIAVVEDLSDSIDIPEEKIQLICERTFVGGDFKLFLSFFPQNSLIEERAVKIGNELDIAQKFCDVWHSKCLVKDNSLIEDSEEDIYYLLKEREKAHQVYIDQDKFDNGNYTVLL